MILAIKDKIIIDINKTKWMNVWMNDAVMIFLLLHSKFLFQFCNKIKVDKILTRRNPGHYCTTTTADGPILLT